MLVIVILILSKKPDCQVKIVGSDGSKVKVKTKNNDDGTITVRYAPELAPGDYIVDIVLDAQPISPITMTRRKIANPTHSYISGLGVKSKNNPEGIEYCTNRGKFTVYAMDDDGNPVPEADCQVDISGKNSSKVHTYIKQ